MSETTSSETTMATPPPDSDDEVSLGYLAITRFQYDNPAITKVTFDEEGDLNLLVGANGAQDQALYTVCSRTLSRTSSVFDALLRSSKTDRQLDDGRWIVRLPYDDPQSIRIVLNIAHGRFRDVPKSMALKTLHQLCVCLDKYRIAECLGPWAKEWCQAARSSNQEAVEDNARIAWVAYVLGNESMFREATKNLLWKASSSSLTPKIDDEHLLPLCSAGILGEIQKLQFESLQSLIGLMHKTWSDCVAKCSSGRGCIALRDKGPDHNVCAAAVAGSLTASLHSRGLLPSSKPIPLRGYVLANFVQVVKDIAGEIVYYSGCPLIRWGVSRGRCGPSQGMLRDIESATESFVLVLAEVHVKRLKEQAERVGVEY
ncbi:hypothetical protein RB595_007107 [Gaeumannomyces hyphopodioides]